MSKTGSLPNLIIIGAPKCGTTSLHYYLDQHPSIRMSQPKELNFFQTSQNWSRGVDWYRSHFKGDVPVQGEASTMYSNCVEYPDVVQRMHGLIPDAKLIYMIRNPLDRIVSQYVHAVALGLETDALETRLETLCDNNNYIAYSKYGMQLEAYLEFYPYSRILVLMAEELFKQRAATMKEVFRFLDVDPDFSSPRFDELRNTSEDVNAGSGAARALSRATSHPIRFCVPERIRTTLRRAVFSLFRNRIDKPMLNHPLKQRLIECLRDDIAKLQEITGRNYQDWIH